MAHDSAASAKKHTIGIAGGGLLGRLCAWHLSRAGYPVTVFDAAGFEQPKGACWTAAGMISPLSELVHSPRVVYDMGLQSLAIWPKWLSELEKSLGQTMHFRHAGSLVVAHPQDQTELNQFYSDLRHKLVNEEAEGRPGLDDLVDPLNHVGIRTLEPALSHFDHALYLKPEGDLNNRRILHGLLADMKKHGVQLVENTKVRCEPNSIITEDDEKYAFDLVLDTRGLGAKPQIEGLRGVRGEVLNVESHEVKLNRPVRLMHPRYKLYVAPKPNNHFVIGATEIESSDMSPMSVQSSLELSSALYTINPAFAEARIIEQSVNCRPAMMDNLPRVIAEKGLIRANGLYRHGYLLSPVVVHQVLMMIDPGLLSDQDRKFVESL
ncbi:FAD-dependent oxidoreductase [Litoribacillus peritrichatus]|uniref:Glycine oxidase ThiO n=1 Tax=Litoribacillus peritrichatus TaxID=718191 RepID=A0ABP7MJY5_9GAMM